jgi:hypothetical protein
MRNATRRCYVQGSRKTVQVQGRGRYPWPAHHRIGMAGGRGREGWDHRQILEGLLPPKFSTRLAYHGEPGRCGCQPRRGRRAPGMRPGGGSHMAVLEVKHQRFTQAFTSTTTLRVFCLFLPLPHGTSIVLPTPHHSVSISGASPVNISTLVVVIGLPE